MGFENEPEELRASSIIVLLIMVTNEHHHTLIIDLGHNPVVTNILFRR